MSLLTTIGRLVLRRTLALGVGAVVIVMAALLVPQAQSLWFQVLRADAGVTTGVFSTATASLSPTQTATDTPTSTATPSATPVLVADPQGEPCANEGTNVALGPSPVITGPAPFAATFDVVNGGPETASGVLLGLRVGDGATYARRVDYDNSQFWLLEGQPDASNLYLVGDLAPGDSREVRLSLATSPEWDAAPPETRVTIDVVVAAGCAAEPGAGTTLVFERSAPPAPTDTPAPDPTGTPESEAADTPEPQPTATPLAPALSEPEVSVPAEPTFAPIGDREGESGTATPPPAPTPTEAPPPTARPEPSATRTPRPSATPQPTNTPAPQATSTAVPVMIPTTPPLPPVIEAESAADGVVPAAQLVADAPEAGTDASPASIVETTPSPETTATVALPTRTPPIGQVLANSNAPESRAARQPKTGYEWIGGAGSGTLAALVTCAALGFVIVAAGIGRRYG